jgi:BirA family biotin operon repressor/biotin-[acetyl-CoA-carboxylase] ligase
MERSLFDLSPRTQWIGRRLDLYASLDSTNRVAEELARGGAPEGTVVLADGQTAGRGRLGRSFFSPPGCSLYLSLLLRPGSAPDGAHEYGFVAAVALADVVAPLLPPGVDLELKWPNDVLLDGRKTSGINLPAQLEGSRLASLVIGIGVNVNLEPSDLPAELVGIATSLRIACGRRLDRVAFAERLLERLEATIEDYRADGFGPVLEAWQKYFRMRGSRVRIGGPGIARELEGTVLGVDAAGALLLRCGEARERILAGDVTVLARED